MPRRTRNLILILIFILPSLSCQTLVRTINSYLHPEERVTTTSLLFPDQELKRQLDLFQSLWEIVNEEYLYPDFNGLDWDAVYAEFHQRIEAGLDEGDFYLAMNEMLHALGDEHSIFLSPEEAAKEDEEYFGNTAYVGMGVMLIPVPERERAVILLTYPDSPAEKAGLMDHDSILSVNGVPVLDEDGNLVDALIGPVGYQVALHVQTPGQEPREMTITLAQINSTVPVRYDVLTSPDGKRVGYIMLPTFADGTVGEKVGEALEAMGLDAGLDGLILDNRMNDGGYDSVFKDVLSYFTDGTVGYFINREGDEPMKVSGSDIAGSQRLPLVVLIGPHTFSYGEVFAGVLKDFGRAYLIGEITEGNVETLWGYDFEDGSRAWIAHDYFRPYKHPEQNWETTGIVPDLTVTSRWDENTLENDPAVRAGLAFFDGE
jgi:C-terminal peptidase prc